MTPLDHAAILRFRVLTSVNIIIFAVSIFIRQTPWLQDKAISFIFYAVLLVVLITIVSIFTHMRNKYGISAWNKGLWADRPYMVLTIIELVLGAILVAPILLRRF